MLRKKVLDMLWANENVSFISEVNDIADFMPHIYGMLNDGRWFGVCLGKPTDNQKTAIDIINKHGGRAGWADSVEKAKEIIDG